MVEILAPAGDFESLRAAVLNGANAVYLGGKEFSARASAGNFDREEMKEAVRFCHAYNTKVYVTINTLLNNSELKPALEYAEFLYETGVDALIVQDIGFLKVLRDNLPDFELHASTQMTAHNLDAVNLLYSMGVKRVVLSRELTLKEIEYIVKNTEAEIEVFVHGALCICFSGQCLYSSMIGGRSGNRGRCAQPCRMEYTLDNDKKAYHLSPKDMQTLEFIKEIEKIGVHSLKIEGRMKRPEYVATIVSSYKRALEGKALKDDADRVTQVFNRGGNTKGYYYGVQGSEMMSPKRPKNWGTYLGKVTSVKGKFSYISLERDLNVGDGIEIFGKNTGAPVGSIKVNDKDAVSAKKGDTAFVYLEGAKKGDVIYKSLDIKLINEAKESFSGDNIIKNPLKGIFTAKKGEKIKLIIDNYRGYEVETFGDEPEIALKTPTSEQRVIESLVKTGDTPFYFEDIEIHMDNDIVVPISKLNALRRRGIELLLDKLQNKREGQIVKLEFRKYTKDGKPRIAAVTGRADIAKASIDAGCDIIFFGGDLFRINSGTIEDVIKYAKGRSEVYPWYPTIILEDYDKLKKQAENLKNMGINKALCGNMGFYKTLREIGYDVFLDSSFNIFNSVSADVFESEAFTLSQELNLKQLRDLIIKTNNKSMLSVYGRIRLMTTRNCIIGSAAGHGRAGCPTLCEDKIHYLKDRVGEEQVVVTDRLCKSHIYSSKILCTIDEMKDIINLNVDYLGINFLDETPEDAFNVIKAYKEVVMGVEDSSYVKKLMKKLEGKTTTGHLHRGVL